MRKGLRSFLRNETGAVAAFYAVGLVGLIAIGGVGFDYARMAGLDSELQNGADQAALAAVTQLDGGPEACARAANVAKNLLNKNLTLLSNDGGSNQVVVTNADLGTAGDDQCEQLAALGFITFYSSYNNPGSFTLATTDEDARIVKVDIVERTARYAFTPIVGAIFSTMDARAVAGLGSAICKVPPLMMCQNDDWTLTKGQGLRLVSGGGGAWTPGNYGYLEVNGPGANNLEEALGANIPVGDCRQTDNVTTEPGLQVSVTDAINTRFDIFESGLVSYCDEADGKCSPAQNTRTDLGHTDFASAGKSSPNCTLQASGWELNKPNKMADGKTEQDYRYLPAADGTQTKVPATMGLPRDRCHATSQEGNCVYGSTTQSKLGNGNWDRALYLKANYDDGRSNQLQTMAGSLGFTWSSITRYEMYQTEIAVMKDDSTFPRSRPWPLGGGNGSGSGTQVYSYLAPQCAPAAIPSETQPDRRLAAIAVVDCGDYNNAPETDTVKGKSKNVNVLKWVEMFFVEPSVDRDRTTKGDIYVEVVREVDVGEGTAGQPVRKDKPYLIE